MAACKQAIQAQPTIPASLKPKLEAECEQTTGGNPTAYRKAAEEVCVKLIVATVPAGASRDQAIASCKVK